MDWGGEAIYRSKRLSDFDWASKNFPIWRGELVWLSTQEGAPDRREPQVIAVYTDRCLVGSAPHCLVRISDPRVYPVECQLMSTSRGVFARNISGKVLKNHQPFEKVLVRVGDVLTFGPVELILSEVNPPSWANGVPRSCDFYKHSSRAERSRSTSPATSFLAKYPRTGSGEECLDWEPSEGPLPAGRWSAWVVGCYLQELVGVLDWRWQSTRKAANDGWPGCSMVVAATWDTLDYQEPGGSGGFEGYRAVEGQGIPCHPLCSFLEASNSSTVGDFWAPGGGFPAGHGSSPFKHPPSGSVPPYPASTPTQLEDCRAVDASVRMAHLGEWNTIVTELRSLLEELRKVQKHSRHKGSLLGSRVRRKSLKGRSVVAPPPSRPCLPDTEGAKGMGSNSDVARTQTALVDGEELRTSGSGPWQSELSSVLTPGVGGKEQLGTMSARTQGEGNGASGGVERNGCEAEGTTRAGMPPGEQEFSAPVKYSSPREGVARPSFAEERGCFPGHEELPQGQVGTPAQGSQKVPTLAVLPPTAHDRSEVVKIRNEEFNSEQATEVAGCEEHAYRGEFGGCELASKEGQNGSCPLTAGHDSSAEEINAYLQQLLSRLRSRRGVPGTAEPDSAHPQAVDSDNQDPANTVGGAEDLGQRGAGGSNLWGRFGARFGVSRGVKKQDAPQPDQISVDLDSFRILASHSARSALTEYRRRRLYQSARGKLWTAAFAVGVAATLVGIANFAPYPPPALMGAWVAIGIAAVMMVSYVVLVLRGVALWLEQKRIDLQTSQTATALALEQSAHRDPVSSRSKGTLQDSSSRSSRSELWNQESALNDLGS